MIKKAIKYVFVRCFGNNSQFKILRILKKRNKKFLKENIKFKDLYRDKRCFIFGNGPSINDLDFSLFENEYVFTVNQLPKNKNFPKLKTNFHLWADERFFDLKKDRPEDMALLETMKKVNVSSSPHVFYKVPAYDMIKEFELDKYLDIYYFDEVGTSKYPSKVFIDFAKPVVWSCTVVHYAICLAVYMGFKEIYLLGCDCTGIINTIQAKINGANDMLYAYEMTENDKKLSMRIQSQNSLRNELYSYAKLLDDYKVLGEYCSRRGVKLINATKGSLLEDLPKVNIEDVLNENQRRKK